MKKRKVEKQWQAFKSLAVRTLMAASLFVSAVGAAISADAWNALGPARIGANFDEISRRSSLKCEAQGPRKLCALSSPGGLLFGGVPVARIDVVFQESALEQVRVSLATLRYDALHRVLTGQYGAGEDRSFQAIAGMAGEFEAGVFVWHVGTAAVVLQQYAGKIDRCMLTYGSESSMADLVRKVRAYPRGARRDL